MESADKNIAVYPEECNSALCRSNCLPKTCQLCKTCLSYEDRIDLLRTHNEHLNKGDCKRIFPPAMVPISQNAIFSVRHYRYFLVC